MFKITDRYTGVNPIVKTKKKIRKPKISFTSKLITAYGGTYLLSNLFEKFKVEEFLEESWTFKAGCSVNFL